jgi:hypothetical protein
MEVENLVENEQCAKPQTLSADAHRLKVASKLAEDLQTPETGDVVFAVARPDGVTQYLYAWKAVLSANNEYFATSQTPSCVG